MIMEETSSMRIRPTILVGLYLLAGLGLHYLIPGAKIVVWPYNLSESSFWERAHFLRAPHSRSLGRRARLTSLMARQRLSLLLVRFAVPAIRRMWECRVGSWGAPSL